MAKKVLNVVDILYNQKKKVEIESSELPPAPIEAEALAEVLQGSETVVVDVAEDGEHVEVHLDADVVNKIDNSLQLPIAPPVETALVGVTHAGAQTNIGVGDGLEITNGVLKATGGSGGTKLYKHSITGVFATQVIALEVISIDNQEYTRDSIIQSFLDGKILNANVFAGTSTNEKYNGMLNYISPALGINIYSGNEMKSYTLIAPPTISINDTVTEL